MSSTESSGLIPGGVYRALDSALLNTALSASLQARSAGDVSEQQAQDLFVFMNAITQPNGYCGRNVRTCRLMVQAAGRFTLLSGQNRFRKVVQDSWNIFKPLFVGDIEIKITKGALPTSRVISSWLLMRSPWLEQSAPSEISKLLDGLRQFSYQKPKAIFTMDVEESSVDAWLELLEAVDLQSVPYGNEAELFIQNHNLDALDHCINSSLLEKAQMDVICGVLDIVSQCPATLKGNPARSLDLMEAAARIIIAYPERRQLINGILDRNFDEWAGYFPIDTMLGQGSQRVRTSTLLLERMPGFTQELISEFCNADFSYPETLCEAMEKAANRPALLRVSPKASFRLMEGITQVYYASPMHRERIDIALEKNFTSFSRYFPNDVELYLNQNTIMPASSMLLARIPYFKLAFANGMTEETALKSFWSAPPTDRSPLIMRLDGPANAMESIFNYIKTRNSAALDAIHPYNTWLLGDYLGITDEEFYAHLGLRLKVSVSVSKDLDELENVLSLTTSEIDRHGVDFPLIQQHCFEQLNMAFGEATENEYKTKYKLSLQVDLI